MAVMSVKDRDKPLEALDRRLEELRELTRSLEQDRDALVGLRDEDAHAAVRDVAERYHISDEALIAFVENAGELLNGKELSVEDARRAGMLAAAGAAWENELGPLLTSAQVRELLGNVSRQRVDELLRSRRLIGMSDRSGRRRFPLFQFRDGRPAETLIAAYWTMAAEGADSGPRHRGAWRPIRRLTADRRCSGARPTAMPMFSCGSRARTPRGSLSDA
jgi:hypothetical protein